MLSCNNVEDSNTWYIMMHKVDRIWMDESETFSTDRKFMTSCESVSWPNSNVLDGDDTGSNECQLITKTLLENNVIYINNVFILSCINIFHSFRENMYSMSNYWMTFSLTLNYLILVLWDSHALQLLISAK